MNKDFVNYVADSIFILVFAIFGASTAISALGDRNHHVHFTTSQQLNGQLLGGLAAAFASGGDAAATMLASNIALSGMANNRQLHRDEVEWLRNNAQDFADQMGISYEEALAILSAEAASRVDSHYASDGGNAAAAAFLDANRPQGLIASTIGNGDFADHNQEWFAATEYQYTNQLINFQTLQGNADIYQHLGAVQAAQGGDLNIFVATMVMSADVDDFANLSPAQTIAMIRVADQAFATSQSLRDTYTQERYDLMIGVALDGAIGTAIQVMDDAAFDALPQADRDYLIDRLVEAYYDIVTTAPGGQADRPAFRSTKLTEEVNSRLPVVGGSVNRSVTEFLENVTVYDRSTGRTLTGTVDLRDTLRAIDSGPPYPFGRDGIPYENRNGALPPKPPGYYKEYTVPTPGALDRGPQRIVKGLDGDLYYTPDHYDNFIAINP